MEWRRVYWLSSLLLLLTLLAACAQGVTPTTIPKSPSPTPPSPSPQASPKPTSSAAPVSFVGKNITVIVPLAPGGGADITARLWANYLPNYLPGKPGMVVRNLPGGDGIIGSNLAYAAKPDGLTLLVGSGGVQMGQLLRKAAVRYDLLKMPVVIAVANTVLTYTKPSIVARAEDLPKAKGIIFGYSAGAISYIFTCAKELLKIPTDKVTFAYTGGADARRAFLSGEINMSGESSLSWNEVMGTYVAKGEIIPLFQSGMLDDKGDLIKDPVLSPDIPTLKDLYVKLNSSQPSGPAWVAYKAAVAASINYQKTLFLHPDTPEPIVRAYWNAADAMLKDPAFRKVADPMLGKEARWVWAQAGDKEFKQNFQMDPAAVEWFRSALQRLGVVID